jgi:hypothetical protein
METYTFSYCFIFLQDPRHTHQPKAFVTRKVATRLASANSGLNEWWGIKERLLKEEE